MHRNNGVWETSDCGGAWKQFVFLTRITGELDSRAVTKETLVMRKKHVHRQAEVVGKEDLCNQEGCEQPRGQAEQPRGNKQNGWTTGREPASISMSDSPRLVSPGALGRGGLGGTRGLWHPFPI